jgi:hypothetical protein
VFVPRSQAVGTPKIHRSLARNTPSQILCEFPRPRKSPLYNARMTITRLCSASLLALAAIMGPVVRGYAREPCCDWVYGKYINLKTGKEIKPPKGAVTPGSVGSAASAANRYCAKPAEATAPPDCIYLSMKDCRASLKGKVGSCYKF